MTPAVRVGCSRKRVGRRTLAATDRREIAREDTLRERIAPLFQENFQRFGELGAALSIWQNGEPLLDLHGGFRDTKREQAWTEDTIVLVWSATKGIGSACLLHALQENKIKIDRRVSEFWPEFGQAGKIDITIAQLVSHSAGLCALDQNVEADRLRCGYSRPGKTNATLATRQRTRLSCANLWIPDRRTDASNFGNLNFQILANDFCRTAHSRFLDRVT